MRKTPLSIEDIKNNIIAMKGKQVKLFINRGRKKIIRYDAIVEDAYTSVFTVKNLQKAMQQVHTYSYNDILCGEVKISYINNISAETFA